MDYNTPLEKCDSLVGICIPSAKEIAERDAARRKWWPESEAAEPMPKQVVRCNAQKFELSKTRPNTFDLKCERLDAD